MNSVWGQSLPFEVTTPDDVTNHTEKLYWMESVGATGFYAVPHSNNQNAPTTTTNAPTLRALWYFMESGEDGYYYIINKETGTYLKKTGTTGKDNTIGVATYASADDVKFKFSFDTPEGITEGSWVIYPKEAGTAGWLSKKSGSLEYGKWLKVSNWNNSPVGDLNSQWKIVARADVQWPQSGLPFVVSTSSDKHYYNINHVRSSTYNISYDADNYVTISIADDKKKVWYFEEAAADPNIDNLKYYYIVNASSEKYLKFTATTINGSNQNDIFVLSDYDSGNEDRFQFVVVNSYDNQGNSWYSIMPKLAMSKYDVSNFANSMAPSSVANNEKLDLRSDRNTDKGHWVFVETDYVAVEAPTITNNFDGTITLSTATDGATIYYTTNGDTPDNTSTEYSSAFSLGDATVIKAIAYVGSDFSDVTTYDVPKCDAPTISFNSATSQVTIEGLTSATIYYTTDGSTPTASNYTGTGTTTVTINNVSSATTIKAIATHAGYLASTVAELTIAQVATPTIQNNGSNAISITCATDGATIYYTTNGDTPTTSSTKYTGPLTENVSGVTIKAIAVKENMIPSEVRSGSVTLQCATPVITRDGMTFSISCSMPTDATFYYSLDGSTPTTSYSGPVIFTTDQLPMTVKAVAKHASYTDSELATFELLNGTGTSSDPYLIYGASDFANFITNVNNGTTSSACYKLEADVSGSGVDPITTAFSGTFDGGFHTISGLTHPLFNTVAGGTVKNLILDPNTTVSGNGAICNEADGSAKIYNCGVLSGTISGSGNVGGLVGHINSGSSVRVVNCYNYASVSGTTYAAGIVGWNEGTIDGTITVSGTGVRIANCMMYGKITNGTNRSPIYCGNHTNNQQKLTEYNFWRSQAYTSDETAYTAYNDQLAIGKDDYLNRFPFYRHILNTHRELAAYFLFADHTDEHISEIGHWVLNTNVAPYPIVERWETNTKRTTEDIAANLPNTTEKFAGKLLNNISTDGYYRGNGDQVTAMGTNGMLDVTVKIGSQTFNTSLPITDMNTSRYDYTWGKVVLPHANEFSGWTRDYDYVCTGWKITSVTKDGSALTTFNIPSSEPYNFADRNNAQKDIYNATNNPYVFAQGGNYIVPYGVTAITIEAHFAKAYYLSDPKSDVGYTSSYGGTTHLGLDVPTTYHGKTVYTNLNTLVGQLSNATNPNDQAIVLVGNYHHLIGNVDLDTNKAVTIMSCDEDNNQEPDYAWYMGNTTGRINLPPIRFDLPVIELGMAARVNGSSWYPGVGIWHVYGWFELTENSLNNSSQFEINSRLCNNADDGTGNNRWIANSGCFVQVVRSRQGNCNKLSCIQVGGNAYIKELYPGSHTDNGNTTTSVPIMVSGGQVDECFMTGYTSKGGKDNKPGTLSGDMIYFWSAGGEIKKFLGAYLEEPTSAGLTAKIDHARIGRFFGGGTSAAARIKGDIDITINNSKVDFYCGGPEFGDMYADKTLATHAIGTTFGEYYGAGFGGTSITYVRKAQNDNLAINTKSTYDLSFTNYTNNRLQKDNTYGIGTCYKFELIFNSNAKQLVTRFYTGYAQFSLATTGNVTNTLSHCVIENDFYGAGCQGKVNGKVTSTLTDCEVKGSAFGGGYKAESNELDVYTTTQPTYAVFTKETGLFSDFGTVEPETYTWAQGNSTNNNTVVSGQTQIYTDVTMSDLGNVTGAISITVDGGTVAQDVFGGGNESKSLQNTSVTIQNGASISGDVFGAGKGKANDETVAYVTGNTTVDMSGGTVSKSVYGGGQLAQVGGNTNITVSGGTIYHNIYGGGAYGSVGIYTYDSSGNITDYTSGGTATINITGGTIGTTGKENGMVFGSSRGDVAKPTGSPAVDPNDRLAWVHDTHVIIGTSGQGTTTSTPLIKGSVYGSGENGHTYQDAEVIVHSGTIGIASGVEVEDEDGNKYQGAAYPYRGNVYGGGCGTDKYASVANGPKDTYNPLAGIVLGNATVNIYGGLVVHNVYGAGAMGSVGSADNAASSGLTTINISGGKIGVDGSISVGDGNVFGAARGALDATGDDLARVGETCVTVSNGTVMGNVYGGGQLGDVGIIDKSSPVYNYTWTGKDGQANITGNNIITGTNNNTGLCTVTISGGTIGSDTEGTGNVFGGGKGVANTFWCEKAMAYATKVSISGATKVNGNVYGGGEVGRVEDDAKVEINTSGGSNDEADVKGNVYGAGAGLETHGYSALVRGNSIVTIKGNTKVGGSVFGGGETASLGRFVLDANKLPKEPDGGGESTVTITDNAKIGLSGTDHDVYGAGQGVEPNWVYREYTANTEQTPYATRITNSKRMMTYTSTKHLTGTRYKEWDYYEDDEDSPYVWEYYPSKTAYLEYLKTLAIASHPVVTIAENATVYGDVYGGGQRGITLGDVAVNIAGGTVKQDVYGGGSLADTNKGNWDDSQYSAVTLPEGHTLTDLYTRTGGSGTAENPYTYAEATSSTGADANTTYYSKGAWATGKYNESTHATTYKTNVTLTGGEIEGDVYGGGLGQIKREAVAAQEAQPAQGTEGEEGYVPAVPAVAAQPALSAVKAKVYGDVLVKLNEDTSNDKCKVHGNIFGCNNQNGSPQSAVTVHVYKTEGWEGHMRTGKELTGNTLTEALNDPDDGHHSYELKGVYGGGNLSAFYPDLKATRDTVQAYVIIDGCKQTSIKQVYGGGNAAPTPATNITIFATYEIEEVFGGGNGKDDLPDGSPNPGANVGYETYPDIYDIPASSKAERTSMFSYGSGSASVTIYDGLIHRVFGGSNTKGNVRESAVTLLDDMSGCDFQIDEAYGGGKNAPMDAEAKLLMACIPGLKAAYGGAQEADILGGVTLTITNGTYERVFGGNNISGTIQGPIVVNVEETGCRPIIIGELYGGGNKAAYSIYGYKKVNGKLEPRESASDGAAVAGTPYTNPVVNVRSFTSIGDIYGGGYGETAVMVGAPTVYVNVSEGKYAETFNNNDNVIEDNAKVVGSTVVTNSTTGYPVPSHAKGAIGAINNVFGGGNAAKVIGTPNVYIGTRMGEEVYMAEIVEAGQTVTGCYTFTKASGAAVAGTTYYQEDDGVYKPVTVDVGASVEDYYTQTSFSGSAVAGTTYYKKYTIKGADIRGNVYGGGNAAEVTGNTNVVIGKEQ